jgi:hypothetical protein
MGAEFTRDGRRSILAPIVDDKDLDRIDTR